MDGALPVVDPEFGFPSSMDDTLPVVYISVPAGSPVAGLKEECLYT